MTEFNVKVGFRQKWWLRFYLGTCVLFGLPIRSSILRRGIVIAMLALLTACPGPQPPHRDAADGAMAATPVNACANLMNIGCVEGADAVCAVVLGNVVDAGLTKIDLACLANAQTREAARKCGGVRCD